MLDGALPSDGTAAARCSCSSRRCGYVLTGSEADALGETGASNSARRQRSGLGGVAVTEGLVQSLPLPLGLDCFGIVERELARGGERCGERDRWGSAGELGPPVAAPVVCGAEEATAELPATTSAGKGSTRTRTAT